MMCSKIFECLWKVNVSTFQMNPLAPPQQHLVPLPKFRKLSLQYFRRDV